MTEAPGSGWSSTTHWSKLLVEGDREAAWSYFYSRYAPAVRCLFLRRGVPAADVEDLAHEFFLAALGRELLERADPERGRFRSYLRTAAVRFLASHWRSQGRQKRGGEARHLPIEAADELGLAAGVTPEEAFDRAWAKGVLERALQATERLLTEEGKAAQFAAFSRRQAGAAWSDVAAALSTTPGAARAWASRAERILARCLREEVAATVGPDDLDEELELLAGLVG